MMGLPLGERMPISAAGPAIDIRPIEHGKHEIAVVDRSAVIAADSTLSTRHAARFSAVGYFENGVDLRLVVSVQGSSGLMPEANEQGQDVLLMKKRPASENPSGPAV